MLALAKLGYALWLLLRPVGWTTVNFNEQANKLCVSASDLKTLCVDLTSGERKPDLTPEQVAAFVGVQP